MACSASDGGIGAGKVTRSGDCEALLGELGFAGCRVVIEGSAARIEVSPDEITRLSDPEISDAIHEGFRRLGLLYVSITLGEGGLGAPDDGGLVAGLPPDE